MRWIRPGRPDRATLDRLVDVSASAPVTYDHVGSTLGGPAAVGRRPRTRSLTIGDEPELFDAAVAALRAWACHRGIGARIHPPAATLTVDSTVLVVLPVAAVTIVVPNRIVAVVDEADRFGFAYGTLPGHQERGEESFVVEREPDGRVVASVTVDAVAATALARLAAPAVAAIQRVAVDRYLGAWRDATRAG